jgi:hypothetical protein
MLYSLELVEIKLEQPRGTGLSGGGTTLIFRGAKTCFGCNRGTATPRAVHRPHCRVPSQPTSHCNSTIGAPQPLVRCDTLLSGDRAEICSKEYNGSI